MAFFLTLQTRRRGHQLGSPHTPRPFHPMGDLDHAAERVRAGNSLSRCDRGDDLIAAAADSPMVLLRLRDLLTRLDTATARRGQLATQPPASR